MSLPLYQLHDFTHLALAPWRMAAAMTAEALRHPQNPLANSLAARATVAACDVFERATRLYQKQPFAIQPVQIGDCAVPIVEEVVSETPFCRLVRFRRDVDSVSGSPAAVAVATKKMAKQHKVLLAAPLSGHYATLLRGTIAEMSRYAEVYVTDWVNASTVPESVGAFTLSDYVRTVRKLITDIGPGTHVMAVCQPSVPVMAAVALMSEDRDPCTPPSMTLMGGPIDTRINPQKLNEFAASHPLSWFRENMVHRVPFGHVGEGREVCPGFLMLPGFVSLNLQRHFNALVGYYDNLLQGATAAVDRYRLFDDEYKAVMDLPAEYYMDTIDAVFQRHLLAKGELTVDGRRVDLSKIVKTAVMTVEGERDDITGTGQTKAAHALLTGLPSSMKRNHEEPEAGHYGIFNGKRWRANIAPAVAAFQTAHASRRLRDAA